MIGNSPYTVTEWEWLKTQLRVRALECSAAKFVTRYTFVDQQPELPLSKYFPEAIVNCLIWCETTDRLIRKKASRSEHLEYYPGWVGIEERAVMQIAAQCPDLSKEFDFGKHVVGSILHNYGMGSLAVCEFYGGEIHWRMSAESVPE